MRVLVVRANTLQRPQRMNCALAAAGRTNALLQRRHSIGQLVIHDQSLGGQAPELVAAVERRDDLRRLRLGEGLDRASWAVLPDDAIDAAVGLVAQIVFRLVGAAASGRGLDTGGLETRRRVVLNDEAVE